MFLTVLLVAGYFATLGIDANHDGVILKPAWDMVHGKVLFRDVFSHYGPMTAYLHAGMMYIFGAKLIVVKLTTAAAYALTGLVLWGISRRVVVVVLWLGLAPYFVQHAFAWPSVYGALLYTVAVWLVLRKKIGWELGVMAALAFWFKQSYAILPIGVILLTRKRSVLVGMAGVSAIILATIVWSGGGVNYIKQNIWIGYINGRILGSQVDPRVVGRFLWENTAWLVIPVGAGWGGWRIMKSGRWEQKAATGLAVVSLIQYLPLVDLSHIYWAITPAFWLLPVGLKSYKWLQIVTVLLMAVTVMGGVRQGGEKIKKNTEVISGPEVLAGIKASPELARYYREVGEAVAGKELVNASSDALYMTFTPKARNILTMYANYSGVTSGVYAYDEALAEYIEKERPVILADKAAEVPAGYQTVNVWEEEKMRLLVPGQL